LRGIWHIGMPICYSEGVLSRSTRHGGRKTEPRDTLFELEAAGLFKSWSLPVLLGQSTDLAFEFNLKAYQYSVSVNGSRSLVHCTRLNVRA
jgi:hypothetical protein